jgi:hypothetical protein
LLFLISASSITANGETLVEVWEDYNVTLKVYEDNTHVTEELTIKNVIDKPVVPGYGYISLSSESGSPFLGMSVPFTESVRAMQISDFSARLDDGTVINDVQVFSTDNATIIKYGFWIPIMPGQSRTIILEYATNDIVKKGIIFDEVTYSIQPSSIPIKNAKVEADIDGKHVSYSNFPAKKNGDTTIWTKNDIINDPWKLNFEYGDLPLPDLPFKWSHALMVLIFGIICIWSYIQWKPDK